MIDRATEFVEKFIFNSEVKHRFWTNLQDLF